MIAILKKELRSMFLSPLAYVVIGGFTFLSAFSFLSSTLASMTSDVTSFFSSLVLWIIIIVAILSMKIFSDEKKSKTDQLLLTSPVSLTQIVLGKFLASYIVYLISMAITFIYMLIVVIFGQLEWGIVFANYLGLFLLGAAVVSIGVFVSSLTESALVSALLTLIILFLSYLASSFAYVIVSFTTGLPEIIVSGISSFIGVLAIFDKYNTFASGMLDFTAIVYYLSITAIFLFLTVRVFEKRRWS
ncbi:MAG: ABC transporter [Ruminococcaceae bacterium]|nr:ABC transporter [Oscillospiraceae bacterium]